MSNPYVGQMVQYFPNGGTLGQWPQAGVVTHVSHPGLVSLHLFIDPSDRAGDSNYAIDAVFLSAPVPGQFINANTCIPAIARD